MIMLWLAALAAFPAPAQPNGWRLPAVVQATARVRIISGVRLKLDMRENADAPDARDGRVTNRDGSVQPARLIEFE